MTERPKRKVKIPSLFKEYIVISENETRANSNSDPNLFNVSQKFQSIIPSSITPEPKKNVRPKHKLRPKEIKTTKPNCESSGSKDLTHSKQFCQDEGKFLCQECGKSLSSSQSFAEHSNIHKNIKPYICEICGKCSRQWSVHSRHLLTHDKDASVFTCTICSKAFRSKVYLKFHIRKHLDSEVKPHTCRDCLKSFTNKTELDRHVISHSSIQAYVCSHCQKKFKYKHNLKAHLRAHMGKQSWKCHVCGACFPQTSLLKAHQRDHKEMIQNVELAKVDSRTINVLTFPLDRRKVAKAQKVTLPKHLSLDNGDELNNSNLSLCLNDVSFPLSVVANSFGTGKYITVKIIDPKERKKEGREKEPIKAFISAAESDLQECFKDESNEKLEQSSLPFSSNSEGMMDSPARPLLKSKNQMRVDKLYEDLYDAFNHCEEKLKFHDYNEDTVLTIKNLVSIINRLDLPLSHETSLSLNKIIFYLQTYLTEKNPPDGMNTHKNFHSISLKSSSFTNGIKYDDDKNKDDEDHSVTTYSESLGIKDNKISISNCDKVIESESVHKVTLSSDVSLLTSEEAKVNKDLLLDTNIKEVTKKLDTNSVHISLWVSIHSLYQNLFKVLQEQFRYKMDNLIENIPK